VNPPLALAMLALGHMGRPSVLLHRHDVPEGRPSPRLAAAAPAPSREGAAPRPEIQREIADLAERFLRDRK